MMVRRRLLRPKRLDIFCISKDNDRFQHQFADRLAICGIIEDGFNENVIQTFGELRSVPSHLPRMRVTPQLRHHRIAESLVFSVHPKNPACQQVAVVCASFDSRFDCSGLIPTLDFPTRFVAPRLEPDDVNLEPNEVRTEEANALGVLAICDLVVLCGKVQRGCEQSLRDLECLVGGIVVDDDCDVGG